MGFEIEENVFNKFNLTISYEHFFNKFILFSETPRKKFVAYPFFVPF